MHACIHACMRACMHVCMYIYICTNMSHILSMLMTHIYTYIHICVHMLTCVYGRYSNHSALRAGRINCAKELVAVCQGERLLLEPEALDGRW